MKENWTLIHSSLVVLVCMQQRLIGSHSVLDGAFTTFLLNISVCYRSEISGSRPGLTNRRGLCTAALWCRYTHMDPPVGSNGSSSESCHALLYKQRCNRFSL